jgi:hypothetical protein
MTMAGWSAKDPAGHPGLNIHRHQGEYPNMSTTGQRPPRARKPWEDELLRLRWLERRVTEAAGGWRHTAEELRGTITGAADDAKRDELDVRAAELEGTADELDGLITSSHAGPGGGAGDPDWVRWHLAEVDRLLEARPAREWITAAQDPGVTERGHHAELPCTFHWPGWRRTCGACREINITAGPQ